MLLDGECAIAYIDDRTDVAFERAVRRATVYDLEGESEMTSHLGRVREHMRLETKALLLQAERARLFDNATNRGSEAEHSIRNWLGARFTPAYSMSSGEIIDSFDTNVSLKSRQQDGVLHTNVPDANRFLLPSGMRLLPIEVVAAVVEVKLTLDKEEFDRTVKAARETSALRLRARRDSEFVREVLPGSRQQMSMSTEQRESGVPVSDASFQYQPVTFALFAFGGIREIETIRGWMHGTPIRIVCCLTAGCVAFNKNPPISRYDGGEAGPVEEIVEASADESLWHFSETLVRVTQQRETTLQCAFHPI